MTRTAIAFSVLLVSLLLLPSGASAGDEVYIGVTSISASSRATGGTAPAPVIDPRLSPFARKLQSLFAYTRYSFLGKADVQTVLGRAATIQLPERFTLEVQPERPRQDDEGKVEMTVTLLRESARGRGPAEPGRGHQDADVVLRTRIRLEDGGTVLLGGPPIAGGVLILALTART